MRLAKSVQLIALCCSLALVAVAPNALAAKKKTKNCKDVLVVSSADELAHIPKSEVEKYFKFIRNNLRLPTAQEVKELGLAKISQDLIFGEWGERLDTTDASLMTGGQLVGNGRQLKSIFSNEQIEALVDAFYKKLKANVKETNIYPPSLQDFALYLGFHGNQIKAFQTIFNKRTGLFRGYEEGFKNNAMRWKNFRNFFAVYPDQTVFTDVNREALTQDIKQSPALIIAGYVSGQPIPDGLERALYTMQEAYSKRYSGKTVPVVTTPAYGIASGLPQDLNNAKAHRYVSPQSILLQSTYGSAVSVNRVALPNRALIPQTGLNRIIRPGETMVIVHPQSVMAPVSSDTNYPSAIVTTGAINEPGHNVSNRAIGARTSAIQNELQSAPSVLVLEKLTGADADQIAGLEVDFRPRSIPFLNRETLIDVGDGKSIAYPRGFADLNKLYGVDGKIYDLPILSVTFGDTHYPLHDRALLENFTRQFLHPETGLKRTDGKPVDILSFVFNDHFDGDWFSSYTDKDLSAKESVVRDPLQYSLDLHLRNGAEVQKDLQMLVERTRGYVPDVYYMHSNHDSDRLSKKLSTGTYVNDPFNAHAYTRLKQYKASGKNPFREYLLNDVGVTYNDHVHVLAPGEKLTISNLAVSHGHMGGVYGKPVNPVTRRAAQGSAANGHTHVAMEYNQIYNAGHGALDFEYAKGWFKQGYQAVIIRTPVHTQLLLYKDGSFFNANTHGNPELEFRPGFPRFEPLPVDTHKLPGQANLIDQYY